MPRMDSVSNGPVESSAEPPAPAAAEEGAIPKSSPAVAATKARGLRRWRRIRRGQEQQREDSAAAASGGGGSTGGGEDEDSAQLHKRRLPLPTEAPKGKHGAAAVEAESSTASVESRFVPPPPMLDPGLGRLIASAGFSVGAGGGADSDNSEDRSSKSSTAASAPRVLPRHEHALLLPHHERDRPRSRAAVASLHGKKSPRAARPRADKPRAVHSAAVSAEGDNSRSSVESDRRSSNAVKARQLGAGLNGVGEVFSDYCEHSDGEQPTEEARSSVVGRSGRINSDSGNDVEETFDEGSVGNGHNGRMHSGVDPYNESILLLQRTQEALENEVKKIMAIREELNDDFDAHDGERSGSVHLREPIEERSERRQHLESRLKEASALIKEKVSMIHELEATPGRMQPGKTTIESTDLLLSQYELDQLYQEKMEAEIRCAILTRAYQASSTLVEDQMALYEAQKSLSADYEQLGLKLQHTENRAIALEDMAEKLQEQCKELSDSSEVLKLQSKAGRVLLLCFVQFILLCIAIGTYLMRLSPSSTEVVPT